MVKAVVTVTKTVEITIDATKMTPKFFQEFNECIDDFGEDIDLHFMHLARMHVLGQVDDDDFLEGYGNLRSDMGIEFKETDTDVELDRYLTRVANERATATPQAEG